MPDRNDRLLELDDPYEDDWEPVDEEPAEASMPPRKRRRLVTPVSAALAAVLVAALGFIGGVQVQKHADKSGSGSGSGAQGAFAAARGGGGGTQARGGFGGGGGFAGSGNGQSAPTVGQVANKNGKTLYVKDNNGNTIKVKTTSHSKISRTASTSAGAIHPGDTVIVQGTKSSSGTITATQINATAAGASSGLGRLLGGGGGFGGGGGGQAPPSGQAPAPPGG